LDLIQFLEWHEFYTNESPARIGVDNRDYHHLSQSEIGVGRGFLNN
jgi:hypothetical protein